MTEKMRRFAEYYSISSNATEAAKAAGYSPKTAYSAGQRLLRNVEVIEYLKSYYKSESKLLMTSIEQICEFWISTMTDENEKITARLKASEYLAKARGMFLNDNNSSGTESKAGGERSVILYLPQLDKLPDEEDNTAAE